MFLTNQKESKGRFLLALMTILGAIIVIISVFIVNSMQTGSEFLTANEWHFYNEANGEIEIMKFNDDFSFEWQYECGDSVGDSANYKEFRYNKKDDLIKLINPLEGNKTKNITILDNSDEHLLLSIDGKVKDYTKEKNEFNQDDVSRYISGYNMYAYIVDGDSKNITLAHCGYDGDVVYPDDVQKTYKINNDAKIYDLQISKHFKDGKLI